MYNISKYKSNNFLFPDHFIDPKEKVKKQWCMEFSEAVYSLYAQDNCSIPFSSRRDMILYRLYGDGNQPTQKYMDYLCPKDPVTQERTGFANISWDIVSVCPKFRRIFINMLDDIDFDVDVTAIDPESAKERDRARLRTIAEMELEPIYRELEDISGIQPMKKQVDINFGSRQEVEMYYEMAYKLAKEISIQKAFKMAFYRSDWQQLKRRLLGDFFDLGIAATKDLYDPATGKVMCRYVDPVNLIARYTRDPKFGKIDFAGEVVDYNISDLRQAAAGQLDEDQLKDIAMNFQSYGSNTAMYDWDFHQQYEGTGSAYTYDNITVPVLDLEWFSYDVKKRVFKKNKYNDERSYRVDFGYESKSNEEVRRYNHKTVYRCKWIIGTDYCFDYGHQINVPMADRRSPQLSYHIYKEARKSLVSSIIPFLDTFQQNWLEFQNATAQAAPAGLAVNISTLKEMKIGEKTMNPLEIMSIRKKTGDLLYKATTHASQLPINAGKPVEKIDGGIGIYREELLGNMDWAIVQIRNIIGINETADATLPDPNQPVGTSEIAYNQTITSLQSFTSGMAHIKESTAKNFYYRYKMLAKYGDIEGYYAELGKMGMQIIKIGKEIRGIELGFMMRMRPTEKMKQIVRDAARLAMRPTKEGSAGLKMSEYLYLESLLDMGMMDYARAYLAHKEMVNMREQQQIDLQNQQMNAQIQQQSIEMKFMADDKLATKKNDLQKDLESHKSMLREREEDNKFLNQIALQEDKLQSQEKVASEKTDSQEEIARMKADNELKKARIATIENKRKEQEQKTPAKK